MHPMPPLLRNSIFEALRDVVLLIPLFLFFRLSAGPAIGLSSLPARMFRGGGEEHICEQRTQDLYSCLRLIREFGLLTLGFAVASRFLFHLHSNFCVSGFLIRVRLFSRSQHLH